MPELNFVDRSFKKENAGKYTIYIQADKSGLAYCILDNTQGNYVVFRRYRFENVHLTGDLLKKIAETMDKDEYLPLSFHSVRFLGYTQQSTLIPSDFFNQDTLHDYLEFNISGGSDGELFSNYIGPLEAHNVFSLPRELVSLIILHYRKVEFSHQATPFLWHLTYQSGALNKPAVYVGLNSGFFDIAVTGNDKLKLYNTFEYVNETDLLYYILNVYKQLGMVTQEIPLMLSGELSSKLIYYDTLKQYIPAVRYDMDSGMPPVAPGLLPLVKYKYLNLLNLHNCVLSAEHIKAER
jgi:hypothetical protein